MCTRTGRGKATSQHSSWRVALGQVSLGDKGQPSRPSSTTPGPADPQSWHGMLYCPTFHSYAPACLVLRQGSAFTTLQHDSWPRRPTIMARHALLPYVSLLRTCVLGAEFVGHASATIHARTC